MGPLPFPSRLLLHSPHLQGCLGGTPELLSFPSLGPLGKDAKREVYRGLDLAYIISLLKASHLPNYCYDECTCSAGHSYFPPPFQNSQPSG